MIRYRGPGEALARLRASFAPRSRDDARVVVATGSDLFARVDHAPLHGITGSDVRDFLRHLSSSFAFEGTHMPRYVAWHPIDHQRFAGPSDVDAGARVTFVETFGQRFPVRTNACVLRCDAEGYAHEVRAFGFAVVRSTWLFETGGDDTHVQSRLEPIALPESIARTPVGRWLRRRVRRALSEEFLGAWATHHIQEIGHLETLVPTLKRRGEL